MDNGNDAPNIGGMPNPNQPLNQPLDQPVNQPTFQQAPQPFQSPTAFQPVQDQPAVQQISQPIQDQPAPQPIQNQPPIQPIQNQPGVQPVPTIANGNNQKPKKNLGVIIGCSVGAVAVIAAVVLLVIFLKNGGKTVTCTMNTAAFGINMSGETNIKVKDGEISGGDATVTIDLKSMSDYYKDNEKEIVDEMTEEYKNGCKEHCTFDYTYTEGDNVKYTMQYDKDGISKVVMSSGVENMSAQEIADKIQETLEDSETTCTQH